MEVADVEVVVVGEEGDAEFGLKAGEVVVRVGDVVVARLVKYGDAFIMQVQFVLVAKSVPLFCRRRVLLFDQLCLLPGANRLPLSRP